ncbi:hypothetical protein TNIN_66491 [Trichonephila inaurata madagascariensis]|uniref:Uncharacterized protein n=1 Tax=Trichonephila inaurata madagascariensis TaxID=2747483 RepID=A0A8X6XS52_9ARAC|nr:hypothetical protein TNIN_66491 [Trichonephila inaurata madagascariensis]
MRIAFHQNPTKQNLSKKTILNFGLAERNDNNMTSENHDKLVVLTSSFTWGPYMHEYAQGEMPRLRHRGTQDLSSPFPPPPSGPRDKQLNCFPG